MALGMLVFMVDFTLLQATLYPFASKTYINNRQYVWGTVPIKLVEDLAMKSWDKLRSHLRETKQTRSMSFLMATQSNLVEKKWTDMMTDCFHQHPL